MKKLITLVFAITLMFGCSSDSSSSDSNQSPNNLLSFKLVGYHNYLGHTAGAHYEVAQLTNGNYKYRISVNVYREGIETPNQTQNACFFILEFTSNQPIITGQIIDLNEITSVSGQFPTNNNPLSNNGIKPCVNNNQTNQTINMTPEITQNTTGQIKITNIDGNKISGTFFFTNLHNFYYNEALLGQNYYQYYGCNSTTAPSAPTTMSISDGTFNNIPKQ